MTAPFTAYAATGVTVGYEPLCSGRLVSWNAAAPIPAPIPLSILTAVVGEDEGRKPRVRIEATVARTAALDTLASGTLAEGWMVELSTGYRWAATGVVEKAVTHERIMLRELVPIIGAGTSELVAVGAESLLIDAHDDTMVYAAARFQQYFQALTEADPPMIPPESTFRSWWWSDPVTSPAMPPGVSIWNTSALLRANKVESDLSNWADPLQAACEANGVEWFCTRSGVLTIRPVPTTTAALAFAFKDGPGGTVTAFRPSASLEGYANEVWIRYADNVRGRARGPASTRSRALVEVIDRTSIVATSAVAQDAAASVLTRLRRYSSTVELESSLILWLKAGDRVTVSVEGGAPVSYVVQTITYRFPRGDMTLTLRTS